MLTSHFQGALCSVLTPVQMPLLACNFRVNCLRQGREFNKDGGGRGNELCKSGNLVNKGPVVRKCRNEGGGNRWEEQVLFSFFSVGQPWLVLCL